MIFKQLMRSSALNTPLMRSFTLRNRATAATHTARACCNLKFHHNTDPEYDPNTHLCAVIFSLRCISRMSLYGDFFRAFIRFTQTLGSWSITRTSPILKPMLEGSHRVFTKSFIRFVLHKYFPRSCKRWICIKTYLLVRI